MTVHCNTCGRPLPSGQLDGLCPACLIGDIGLNEPEDSVSAEDEISSTAPTKRKPAAKIALEVEGYTILSELGRGGMGIVYRAREEFPERDVALKMLLPAFTTSADLRHRFRQEAAALSRLDHAAILPVFTTGEHDGFPWFTMKLATGGNLADRISKYRGDWNGIANLMALLADGLQYAHDHGVLHRDLKPGNILFDEQDRPYIADFGLAKIADSDSALTRAHGMLGTPQYVAPEIIEQDARAATTVSDLYGLGAILHELLTSKPPFEAASSGALLQSIIEKPPYLESRTTDDMPRDLRVICLKCLAKDPATRYRSARELANELRRFVRGEPIKARPAGLLELTWRWCRRRPRIAALIALSAFLLLAVIVVTVVARFELGDKERALRRKDYVADMRMTDHAIEEKNFGQALELLEKWDPAVGSKSTAVEDLRDFEWGYFREMCRSDELAVLGRHDSRVCRVAWSPDGTRIASAAGDGEVKLWDAKSRKLVGRGKHSERVMALVFSGDSKILATGSDDHHVRLWDATTMKALGERLDQKSPLVTLLFTPNPTNLLAMSRESFSTWDLATHAPARQSGLMESAWFYGAISPQFDTIAVPSVTRHNLAVWDVPPVKSRELCNGLFIAVAYSGRGDFLAAAGFDGRLYVWRANDFERVFSIPAHEGMVASVAWSPAGDRLATGGADGFIKLWDSSSGKPLATFRGNQGLVGSLSFSPDGKTLVSGSTDFAVRLWDCVNLPAHESNPSKVDLPFLFRRHEFWIVGTLNAGDTEWIDTTTLKTIPIPIPPEVRSTNQVTVTITNGFLLLGPGKELRRFDRKGNANGPKVSIPRWPIPWWISSRDGRWLFWFDVTNANTDPVLWEIGSSLPPVHLEKPGITWLFPMFSYDGTLLAAATMTGEVVVWSIAERRLLRRFPAVSSVSNGLAFSRDGKRLVVSAVDGTVRIWNTENWESPPMVLSAGTRTVWCVNFSPDGQRLAAGGDDGRVFLWDLRTGQLVTKLTTSKVGLVGEVGFSEDGNELLAGEMSPDANSITVFKWRAQDWKSPNQGARR